MTLLGVWFTRAQKDLRTYFVGGRNVGWFMVLISIVATETSTVTFLSVPGLGFNPKGGNLTFLQLAFGYIIGRCLVAWLLLPQYMRGELFTAYQVLRQRFDPAVQRRRQRPVPRHPHRRRRAAAVPHGAAAQQYVGWGIDRGDRGRGRGHDRLHLPRRHEGGHLDRPDPVRHQDRRGGRSRRSFVLQCCPAAGTSSSPRARRPASSS